MTTLLEQYRERLDTKRQIARNLGKLIAQMKQDQPGREALESQLATLTQLEQLNQEVLDVKPKDLHEYLLKHIQNPAAILRLENIFYGSPDPVYGLPQDISIVAFMRKEREILKDLLPELTSFVQGLPTVEQELRQSLHQGLIDLHLVFSKKLRLMSTLVRDLERLHKHPLQVNILGIGEITTTITLNGHPQRGKLHPRSGDRIRLAYKRMPSFPSVEEAQRYRALYHDYYQLLTRVGIGIPHQQSHIVSRAARVHVVYSAQERLPGISIAANILPLVSEAECVSIFNMIMERMLKIFEFNRRGDDVLIGFDGQIPNWSVVGFDPDRPVIKGDEDMLYLDTSTPLLKKDGIHQINTEVFIKSVPGILRPIFRRTLVKQVLDRYFEPKEVVLDLLASYILYDRPDALDAVCRAANEFTATRMPDFEIPEYTSKAVEKYHKLDTMIWVLFRFLKRMDRRITQDILGRPYEQRLPDHKFVPGPYEGKYDQSAN